MHILLIPSWYPNRKSDVSGVFFRDQAIALSQYGHKVGVISIERKQVRDIFQEVESTEDFELDEGILTYRRTSINFLPRIPYGNYYLWKRVAWKLLNMYIEKHGRPDVIHGHSAIFGGVFAAEVGKYLNIPTVFTEHSSAFARNQYRPWLIKLSARAAELATYCIAVSPSLGELLAKKLPVGKDINWHWIPNIVSNRFSYIKSLSCRKGDTVRFVNIGMMNENKGQRNLLKAFARAFQGSETKELWLVGDGSIRGELEALALNLGVAEQIKFVGRMSPEDIPRLLNEIDVLVVSSLYETFGVVAAEALMTGKPVVATRCGGADCIVSERDGLLVQPNNIDEMAHALINISENLNDYSAEDIHLHAKQRFSSNSIAMKLTAVYESIIRS